MLEDLIIGTIRKTNGIIRKSKGAIHSVGNAIESKKQLAMGTIDRINLERSYQEYKDGYVNYYENRVMGEFIRMVAYNVNYHLDQKQGKLVAYLVRKKTRLTTQIIEFSYPVGKSIKEADIYYCVVDKLLNTTGIKTHIGNMGNAHIIPTDEMTKSLSDAVVLGSPPYLSAIKKDKGKNKFIVSEEYILNPIHIVLSNGIKILAEQSMIPGNKYDKKINSLVNVAGIHLVMSFCESLDSKFYGKMYLNHIKKMKDLFIDVISEYNAAFLNTMKVRHIRYDESLAGVKDLKNNPEINECYLIYHGIEICFNQVTTRGVDEQIKIFNNAIADVILNGNDNEVSFAFRKFILSTGIDFAEDSVINKNDAKSLPDKSVVEFYENVQENLDETMKNNGFVYSDDNTEPISEPYKNQTDVFYEEHSDMLECKAEEPPIIKQNEDGSYVEVDKDDNIVFVYEPEEITTFEEPVKQTEVHAEEVVKPVVKEETTNPVIEEEVVIPNRQQEAEDIEQEVESKTTVEPNQEAEKTKNTSNSMSDIFAQFEVLEAEVESIRKTTGNKLDD